MAASAPYTGTATQGSRPTVGQQVCDLHSRFIVRGTLQGGFGCNRGKSVGESGDVRELEDFQKGHVPGALNLPKDEWDTFKVLRKDAVNLVYCYTQTCHLAAQACARFAEQGYRVMEMDGGFAAWKDNGLPVE